MIIPKRLTTLLLQADGIVEKLILGADYVEKTDDLMQLKACILEALELLNDVDNFNDKNEFSDRILKIIDIIIRFYGLKNLSDFY